MSTTHLDLPRLTAAELEQSVLSDKPSTAVFDCDGTLWAGDSGHAFMLWSIEQGLVSRSSSDWIDTRYRAYNAGNVSELSICGEMVQIYEGLREQELRSAAAEFFRAVIEKQIFPEMASLVERLHASGATLWAVSSTNRWVVAEGVSRFGIPESRVLAADVRVAEGLLTSELLDVPSGEGKAESLRRVGLAHPDAVFGNSIHDLAMLAISRRAYPINPSPALQLEAARRGWPAFHPASALGITTTVAGE